MTLIKTKKYGTWELIESPYWGRYFRPSVDPDGYEVEEEELLSFELLQDFPRLPNNLMQHIVSLMKRFSIEVQVVLIRSETQTDLWRVLVPKQGNTAASVTADTTDLVDLITGERYTNGIPVGWVQAGTAHSHPNMMAFWSTTDDKSELKQPGLHFTVGGRNWSATNNYTVVASICLNGTRHILHPSEVIDIKAYNQDKTIYSHYARSREYLVVDSDLYSEIHPNVLEQISQVVYVYQKAFGKLPPAGKTVSKLPAVGTTTYFNNFDDPDSFEDYYNVNYHWHNPAYRQSYTKTELEDVRSTIIDYLMEGGEAANLKELLMEYTNEV